MNYKTRRRLLVLLIIGFLLTAGGFLFYALGWSISQMPSGVLTFKKTGAILLKTQPSDAFIKINNQSYVRKHNLLINNGRELISGVLPGNYQIEIFKEGFGRWQKNLSVTAGLISSATKIVLFPEKISTEIVAKTEAEKFWFMAEKKKEAEDLFYSLKQKQLKMPGRVPIIQITAFPFDTTKILIASQKALYFLDRENFNLELLISQSIKTFGTNGSEIVFLDQENNLQFYDLDSRQITDKISLALPEKVKKIRFSPDNKKIAALIESGEIEIIYLEDYHRDFEMTAGEKVNLDLNITTSDIINFDWLPKIPDYLVINYPDKMIIAETDPRPPTNWWLLAENVSDFAFDSENNLYLQKENQFFRVIL